jgi:phage-related tail protein
MNKTLTALKPFITLKVLLIAGGTLVILAVLAFGVVRYEQAEAVSAAQAKSAADKRHEQAEATKQHVTELETATATYKTALTSVCGYVKQLDATPTLTKAVTPPAQCL